MRVSLLAPFALLAVLAAPAAAQEIRWPLPQVGVEWTAPQIGPGLTVAGYELEIASLHRNPVTTRIVSVPSTRAVVQIALGDRLAFRARVLTAAPYPFTGPWSPQSEPVVRVQASEFIGVPERPRVIVLPTCTAPQVPGINAAGEIVCL